MVIRASLISAFIFFALTSLTSQTYYEQFQNYVGTKDTVSLEKLLPEWQKKEPNSAELYTSWFNYYILKGRKEIIAREDSSHKSDSSFVLRDSSGKPVYYVRGDYYYIEKTINEGFKMLDKGIKKHPDRLDMYFGKAWLLGDMGKTKEQAAVILQIIDRSVKNKNQWLWTLNEKLEDGQTYMLTNIQHYIVKMFDGQKLDEVKTIVTGILNKYPDHTETISNYGVYFLYKNEYDKALEQFLKAEQLSPNDAIVLSNIAYTYAQKNEKDKAIAYYEKVIEIGDEADKEYAKNQITQLKSQK